MLSVPSQHSQIGYFSIRKVPYQSNASMWKFPWNSRISQLAMFDFQVPVFSVFEATRYLMIHSWGVHWGSQDPSNMFDELTQQASTMVTMGYVILWWCLMIVSLPNMKWLPLKRIKHGVCLSCFQQCQRNWTINALLYGDLKCVQHHSDQQNLE